MARNPNMMQLDGGGDIAPVATPTPTEGKRVPPGGTPAVDTTNMKLTPALQGLKTDAAASRVITDVNKILTTSTTPEDIALAAKAGPPPAGTFLRWDYVGRTQTDGTLRRAVVADGKGGEKLTFATEKNPDYVSGSRGTGVVGANPPVGGGNGNGNGNPSGAPGNAWVWNGTQWVKPAMPTDGKTYTWDDAKGWVTSDINTKEQTAAQVDSIAAISALLSSYGIGDLSDAVTAAVKKGYSSSTIQLIMQDPNSNDPLAVAFQNRFPANKARLAAGKAVLSASEYLAAERTYSQVFQSYGMSTLAKRDMFNKFIAGDVSAAEVSDRIGLAVNRVKNADANTKAALAQYYPMLNQTDIVSAMLDPQESLPALQRKVQIGEIGGAALAQGLTTSLTSTANQIGSTALAELGITKEQARAGFAQVAEVTPRAEFLSSISSGADYGRLEAEQEAFQSSAKAKQARLDLTAQEQGRFSGKAGTMGSKSLASQQRAAGLI
jgi:hypothetical protein